MKLQMLTIKNAFSYSLCSLFISCESYTNQASPRASPSVLIPRLDAIWYLTADIQQISASQECV